MRKMMIVILVCGLAIPAISQSSGSSKYWPGTIMAVTPHRTGPGENASSSIYDVSVKVDNTLYVVLYTQPPGTIDPQYRTGLEVLVSVGRNTMKFNDQLGRSQELPILSRRTLSATKSQSVHPISAYSLIRTLTQVQI
jgi:hypothetical protein